MTRERLRKEIEDLVWDVWSDGGAAVLAKTSVAQSQAGCAYYADAILAIIDRWDNGHCTTEEAARDE